MFAWYNRIAVAVKSRFKSHRNSDLPITDNETVAYNTRNWETERVELNVPNVTVHVISEMVLPAIVTWLVLAKLNHTTTKLTTQKPEQLLKNEEEQVLLVYGSQRLD